MGSANEITIHANLTDALNLVESTIGSIIFIDDNIVSGTQASTQLDLFMGGSVESREGNYVMEHLDERLKGIFRSCEVGAAFAVGYEDGAKKLTEAAARHNVRLAIENVTWGKPVPKFSGVTIVSERLRTFLREIGATVLQRRFEREASNDAAGTRRSLP